MKFVKNVVTNNYLFVSANGNDNIIVNAESEAAARMKLPIDKRKYLLKEIENEKGDKINDYTVRKVRKRKQKLHKEP